MPTQESSPDFLEFAWIWNHVQHQPTPAPHRRIARWLQARHDGGDQRLLLMAFRGCGKSTMVGLFCAWRLLRAPDTRIRKHGMGLIESEFADVVDGAPQNLKTRIAFHHRDLIRWHITCEVILSGEKPVESPGNFRHFNEAQAPCWRAATPIFILRFKHQKRIWTKLRNTIRAGANWRAPPREPAFGTPKGSA
jgi:hypothetical protein